MIDRIRKLFRLSRHPGNVELENREFWRSIFGGSKRETLLGESGSTFLRAIFRREDENILRAKRILQRARKANPSSDPGSERLAIPRRRVRPEEAQRVASDEHLKAKWASVNADISKVYEILGPPPLKTLSGTRHGK